VRRPTPLVLLALVPLAACGDDDDGGGASAGFASMLADVPADAVEGELPMLQYVDMDLVWEQLGVAADATSAERLDAMASARADGVSVLPPRLFAERFFDEATLTEVGFDAGAIRREIAVDAPPSELRIVDVAVDADAIDEATATDPVWSDRRESVEGGAGDYFDWTGGDDELASNVERITPMRPLGIGGQLAVVADGDGARVVRTKESALMEAALETAAGDETSAAEDGPFAGAGDVFTGDVMQLAGIGGAITGLPAGLSPAQLEAAEARMVFIEPYESILAAQVVADGATRFEVVLLHEDEDGAAANEEPVTELLTEGVTMQNIPVEEVLPGATVEVDGTAVRIVSADARFDRVFNALISRDLFLTR
jgi:hypothetical protein